MAHSFCKHFRDLVEGGDYTPAARADRAAVRKAKDQERTAGKRITRNAVEAHFAGDL
jgi:hypothetical protein